MRKNDFSELVRQAVESLPQEIRSRLDNVDVVVEDWPNADQLWAAGLDDRHDLLGLYEGIPLIGRESYGMVLPDKITIFQRPIETACHSNDEIVREVRLTVAHEIAHHFGIDDERLATLGLE